MRTTFLAAMTTAALVFVPVAAHAVVYEFDAKLNGASEVPAATTSLATGTAALFYDDHNSASTADDTYSFSESVAGLSGSANGAHIHLPAGINQTAPVVVSFLSSPFSSVISGGALQITGSGIAPPSPTFLSTLQAGLAYSNVHTALYPGGEIRGQMLFVAAVPEPSTYALLGLGLGVVGLLARRRGHSAGTR